MRDRQEVAQLYRAIVVDRTRPDVPDDIRQLLADAVNVIGKDYDEEAKRVDQLVHTGRALLKAIGPGVSEYTSLGAAMQEFEAVLDAQGTRRTPPEEQS